MSSTKGAKRLSFSQRQGYREPASIVFRDELPSHVREPLVTIALKWLSSSALKEVVDEELDPYGIERLALQTKLPSPWEHVIPSDDFLTRHAVNTCPWPRVYDIIEAIYRFLAGEQHPGRIPVESAHAADFERAVNAYFTYAGIGWQLVDGKIIMRGDDGFEQAVKAASSELRADNRLTAANQIQEALQALSRRPEPNVRGAIFHAMGALECIIRALANDQKLTLGDALKRNPNLVPKPVDGALEKLWGYASNKARHVAEGQEPNRDDAELIVGLSASVSTYLTRKHRLV